MRWLRKRPVGKEVHIRWRKKRPIQAAVIVFILNMEIVVIPFILKGIIGLSGMDLKITAALWATAELCFWYVFSGWLIEEIKKLKEIQKALKIGKEAIPEVKSSNFFRLAEEWINKNIIDRFDPEKQEKKIIYYLLKSCGFVLGLPLCFISGLVPVFWIPCVIVTRVRNWKLGFCFLALGNMAKNIFFAESWDYIWLFFGPT